MKPDSIDRPTPSARGDDVDDNRPFVEQAEKRSRAAVRDDRAVATRNDGGIKSPLLANVPVAKRIGAPKHPMETTERYRVIDGAISYPKRPHLPSSHDSVLGTSKLCEAMVPSLVTFP